MTSAPEPLLAAALATLAYPIFLLEDGVIRYANGAAAHMYGWTASELVGVAFSTLQMDPATSELEVAPTVRRAEGTAPPRQPVHRERHRRRDGSEFLAATLLSPLDAQAGLSHGCVVSVRDVTDEQAHAERLGQAEKLFALSELVAGIAHEINNPLTGILAFATLLLDDPLNDEQREAVSLIKREAERATAVIRELLRFVREREIPLGPVDLNALVEHTLRLRAYFLGRSDIAVALDLDHGAPPVHGDAQRLQQVLINLVMNAEQAMQERPIRELTIRTRHEGYVVRVEVGDSGTGMSPAVQRRIFEPFFTTKAPGVGTGLGLSVSYGIVQAHHGTLEVTSVEGRGTTMTLRIPVQALDPAAPLEAAAP